MFDGPVSIYHLSNCVRMVEDILYYVQGLCHSFYTTQSQVSCEIEVQSQQRVAIYHH